MKLDVNVLRYLSKDEFRVLTATEMGMKNHEIVPTELIERIAGLKHGGAYKNVKTLLRHKLVHHDASKYDGYRLTNLGYDFLAIKTLVNRGVISGLGRQIGVGKESDIFEVVTEDGKTLALKLHRLGRTSFRAVKSKRDYLKHRNSFNWLYLSRLAALKEYAFMKALGEHGFPVPEAVDWNRHCVLMTLVPGFPLVQVKELQNPGMVFQYIMGLIVRLAQHGLIHCDFNEFNIMIDENEKVTMIDFPQMVSVSHHNAEMYFQRDAECIFTFFNKQYHYDPLRESNGGEMLDGLLSDWELDEDGRPDFNAIARDSESLDKELAASGFTHQNQKDLEKYGFGIADGETSSEDGEGDKCDEIVGSNQDIQHLDSSHLVDGRMTSCDVIESNISTDSIENIQRNVEPECTVLAHEDDAQGLDEKKDDEEHSSSGDEEDIQQSKRIEKQRKHAAASVRVGSRYHSSRNANKDKGGRRSRFHVNSDF